MLFINTVFMCC